MPEPVRRVWAKFWELVDGDSVRPFIWIYYVPLLAFSILAVVVALILSIVSIQPATLGVLWVWVQIPATASAMTGLALRHGGTPVAQMGTPLLFRDWMGLSMQFGGHACMAVVLMAFELVAGSVIMLGPTGITGGALGILVWWVILFAMFAIASYVFGCLLLALQVARKIKRGHDLRRAG
jgi:hypothetical protein